MWFFHAFWEQKWNHRLQNKGHTSVRSYIYPPLTLSVHSIRIFSLDFKEKIEIFIFLWFLGTANVLKILDTKNHIILLDISVWKKYTKIVSAIYYFELVWTPTPGRGHIPIKRSSRAWKFNHFLIFAQLSPNQKNIYTWSLQNFLGVLKSYESESFISAGLSLVA